MRRCHTRQGGENTEECVPAFGMLFPAFPRQLEAKETTVHYKGRHITFRWVAQAYTCARLDFDNFLFSLVGSETGTALHTGQQPTAYTRDNTGITITTAAGMRYHAPLVIGADGAHSPIAKQFAARSMNRAHHIGAVRAYYANFPQNTESTVNVYVDKRYLPSYFWVFSLAGNRANAGIGMLSSEIAKRRVDLKKLFHDFIEGTPALQQSLKPADLEGRIDGFGLPLGSHIGTICGQAFMLTGDAASLIDPISGEGIGNATVSGKLAAEQAIRCFRENNFSEAFMQQYDRELHKRLDKELKQHYQGQRLLSAMPFMLDVLFAAARVPFIKRILQKRL